MAQATRRRSRRPAFQGALGLAAALAPLALAACGSEGNGTHVFVRDPHQVWVEAASLNGEEVVLPPGQGLRGVRIREGDDATRAVISYATLYREPSGGITVDDRMCAPWPTSPLGANGELHIQQKPGDAPYVSDGPTVRVAYLCAGPHHEKVELDFVTPWTNVREVRVVQGEPAPGVATQTHPALVAPQ